MSARQEEEEISFAKERQPYGMAALYELVYDDENLLARKYIRMLTLVAHISGRCSISAELADKTTCIVTRDTQEQAMRALLAEVVERVIPEREPMELSPAGLEAILGRCCLRRNAVQDIAGIWVIGYEHVLSLDELSSGKISVDGQRIAWRGGLTEGLARGLLDEEIEDTEERINEWVRAPLRQCQFDALVSLALGIGLDALRCSRLLSKLNDGDHQAVPGEMERWSYLAGRKRHALLARRRQESSQWLGKLQNEG